MSEHGEHITSHPHAEHGAHGAAALPFTEADWREFHKSDIGAGAAIIVLMTAIFSIGLVLYTIIAIVVGS
jgi:hypothetical protein